MVAGSSVVALASPLAVGTEPAFGALLGGRRGEKMGKETKVKAQGGAGETNEMKGGKGEAIGKAGRKARGRK